MVQLSQHFIIPADVPLAAEGTYKDNYNTITHGTNQLLLLVADQYLDHDITNLLGNNIPREALDPEYCFKIAHQGDIGALAAHPGLIARYAPDYPNLNYIVKLTGKTTTSPMEQKDLLSIPLLDIQQVIALRDEADLNICGIGMTIYPGSLYEEDTLAHAGNIIYQAHQHGLVAILWVLPRGKSIREENSDSILGNAAGIATSLGADFCVIKLPRTTVEAHIIELLAPVIAAAGNTKIMCNIDDIEDPEHLLNELYIQMYQAHTHGCAIGKNIFHRHFSQALALIESLAAIIYDNATASQAVAIYHEHKSGTKK